jgi:hypothetical protein
VIEHSRQKETLIIRSNGSRHVAGSKKGLVVVHFFIFKINGFLSSLKVDILNLHSLGPLKSCGLMMDFNQAYTLRKSGRMLIWSSYRLR